MDIQALRTLKRNGRMALYTDFAKHQTFIARAGGGQNQAGRAPEPSPDFFAGKKRRAGIYWSKVGSPDL